MVPEEAGVAKDFVGGVFAILVEAVHVQLPDELMLRWQKFFGRI